VSLPRFLFLQWFILSILATRVSSLSVCVVFVVFFSVFLYVLPSLCLILGSVNFHVWSHRRVLFLYTYSHVQLGCVTVFASLGPAKNHLASDGTSNKPVVIVPVNNQPPVLVF